MEWSLDTITAFFNVVLLLPLVVCLMEFYWLAFRQGVPVVIGIGGGFLWSLAHFSQKGVEWNSLASLFHIGMGMFIAFCLGLVVYTLVRAVRGKHSKASLKLRIVLLLSVFSIGGYLWFNQHFIKIIDEARVYTTPPERLEQIAHSSLVWKSPTLFKMLSSNPYLPEGAVVFLYEDAKDPFQRYQLLKHENMPCSTVKAFMDEYKDSESHAWMVAMARRNHYMRCEVPEIYTLSEDELMDRTPLEILETMSREFYGEDDTPGFIREWINKKRKEKKSGKVRPRKPLPLPEGM